MLQLQFEDGKQREYAASLTTAHTLNRAGNQPLFVDSDADRAANLLAARSETILPALAQRLRENGQLAQGGDAWFPHDLLLEINAGQYNSWKRFCNWMAAARCARKICWCAPVKRKGISTRC